MLKKYKIHLLVLLGLIILNLAIFAVNLNDFFLSDDFDWLYLTKTSQHSLSDYFTANYYGEQGLGGSYRPLVNVAFWLNYHLFGLDPLPYHLTNLFFHIAAVFLIYLLALQLFKDLTHKNKIAVLAAVFFSLLPNHSEAVIWIAAVADPVATFFYLLAFYLYIIYRRQKSFMALIVSLLSFVLALLTKEIAITLPLLILVWELYQYISAEQGITVLPDNATKPQRVLLSSISGFIKEVIFPHLGYWLVLIVYFLIRYLAIGLVWGYYAADNFKLDFANIYTMFTALITNLLFYGQIRVVITDFLAANWLFGILFFILVAVLILMALRKNWLKGAFLIDSYIILSLPVVFLAYNKLSDEGERYNYLPSVAFCLLISLLVVRINKKYWQYGLIGLLVIYFGGFLIYKNLNWQQAANISSQIVLQDYNLLEADYKPDQELYFIALPDNYTGAPILRNGMIQAVKLFYPDQSVNATMLNAYLRLTRDNWQEKILYWGSYATGGYYAETFDHENWLTGFDRRETADNIFELWGYDYKNYTSNQLRLILKDDHGNFIPAGEEEIKILIFNQGKLQGLN